jgi:hypothetical protein
MAETIGLEVFLGMDAKQLQAELQKSENQLRQFQNQLKKSTNSIEISMLNREMSALRGTITNINTAMGNTAKRSGDATQSLINLSRVAQDAPYGFIGIANNINPLLESFQRLQKESGSTGNALKSLAGGLIGAGGLGLAVGIASSLLVTYSKEIAEFFNGPTEKLKKFREELNKLNQDIYKIVGEAQTNRAVGLNLVNVITGGDTKKSENALAQLKKLYKDNAEIQNAKVTNDKAYLTHLVNMASKQEEFAGKEQNTVAALNKAYEERNRKIDQKNKELAKITEDIYDSGGGIGGRGTRITVAQQKEAVKKRYAPQLEEIDLTINRLKSRNLELNKTLTGFATPDKKGGKAADPMKDFSQNLKSENNAILQAIQRRKELGKTANYIRQESPEDKAKAEKQRLAGIKLFGESKMTGEFGKSLEGKTSAFYEEQKKVNEEKARDIQLTKEQTDANLMLADTMSNYATNAFMNLYNSMQQGLSIGDALGKMFMDLASQIAAAAVKAAIFQSLMSVFSGGASAATTITGGLGGVFEGILGLASGGVVNGPTLAMIGEGSESEAVMPLSKLGSMMQNTFNAGAMASNGGGGNGEFVLRGQDLVLAMNRSETSLKYRRG